MEDGRKQGGQVLLNFDLKIFVAGHRGLVGSHILDSLKQRGYKNFVLRTKSELDLRRQSDTENFFAIEKPDWVFLAAAKVGGILANSTYKAEFIYDNLAIALNIIHSAFKFEVKKLLNLGSSCIYPKFSPQPMKEEYLLSGYLEPTNEPYAIAKISAIKLVRYYNERYGTNFFSVMPTNLYGPRDNFNLETSHVIPALIRKFHLAKLLQKDDFEGIIKDIRKTPLGFGLDEKINFEDQDSIKKALSFCGVEKDKVTLWGSGEVFREFLYVEDLASCCVFLMEKINAEDIKKLNQDYFVNVGTGEDLKIKEVAQIVKDVVGFQGEISWDRSKPDGTPRKLLDVSLIKKLGWEPSISLKDGIKKHTLGT
jgi:Nucleoside-diphosphate-sugar epimerases